ncbi:MULTISPECIES: M42 family metallopeptidase [unclassified Arcicella]|uniref:M42 family metallopeptidase n=1 Tax=unclassified Arcicella TaxID=2644986 RepID=UPI002867A8A9|nr:MULTISPECIES: M42 family metallopeptidase [unclassified Arcicella]MDR6562886.1 putative aminopeptidase FrvX [Arcicella sp. BE51]MDR6812773.1 putative aminopeptidase FrvX [Arcicella sp. BE140]MDR6824085.1 putative aminopeptidase FrvX [Arcicella sp. BE139]
MTENAKTFLYEYLNNASPTGFEASGQQIWLDYIKPYIDETIIDVYGTAVGVIKPNTASLAKSYKVVIEAHADEISWFVNYIDDNGYIFVRRNGGSDAVIAPSMRCNLHTKKGVVKGVFGYPAIHVRDLAKDKAPTVNDIFIDLGAANKKEVEEMGVHVGTVVTFEDGLTELNNRYYVGRALDNRIGGFMIAEVARMLKENKVELPFTLYVVNAVQEEIGLRGAEMIVRRLKPDVAIVTDVTHDTQSPMYNKKEQGDLKCGAGPVICYGPAVQNNLRDFIIDVAESKEIKIQRQAVSRSTGTDTDSFAYATEGVASALISLPLKYMHTTVETVAKDDVQAVINLIYESLLALTGNEDWRYLK